VALSPQHPSFDFCFAFASRDRVLTDSLLALSLGKVSWRKPSSVARLRALRRGAPKSMGWAPARRPRDSNGRDIFAHWPPIECRAALGALVAERPRPVGVARLRVDADFAAGHNPIEPGADAT